MFSLLQPVGTYENRAKEWDIPALQIMHAESCGSRSHRNFNSRKSFGAVKLFSIVSLSSLLRIKK